MRRGAKHDIYTKKVGGETLRTTISRDKSEYRGLESGILRQLGVDKATFYEVLGSGKLAQRIPDVDVTPPPSEIPQWCLSQLSSYFSDAEISDDLRLTDDEAQHVVKNAIYSAPTELDREEIRERVRESLTDFRTN
ncbi:hypothetical protein [Candidatus Poriferisodalis sp.]|uniref:hypothetical protein n=1 Tax=Candidatus Poriferisodalis sp. TaxID=3101277 RepID=UPI003D0C81DC